MSDAKEEFNEAVIAKQMSEFFQRLGYTTTTNIIMTVNSNQVSNKEYDALVNAFSDGTEISLDRYAYPGGLKKLQKDCDYFEKEIKKIRKAAATPQL